jgi:phenylpropionate dioxygenase-like ring-hydroxylating dioxygenase large terminal subunit
VFLKNYWYVGARSDEVEGRPLGRILLNEPVVFLRKKDGSPVALEDRCPHRGYPLSKGRFLDDTLECAYHGLLFDCQGRCLKVPSQSHVPAGAVLRTFPTVEQWGFVWIWMGNPELADIDLVPSCTWFDHPDWDTRGERLRVKCHYQLIIDNLLDMTHLPFVHPHTIGSAAKLAEVQVKNEITENSVTNSRWWMDVEPPPTYARGTFKGNVDRWQISRFLPPAFTSLDAGAAETGSGAFDGDFSRAISVHTLNVMTPETETTTHYYWAIAQNRRTKSEQLREGFFRDIQRSVQEDVAVFEAHQRSLELKPDAPMVAIMSDAAPLAARRIIERLLEAEEGDRPR